MTQALTGLGLAACLAVLVVLAIGIGGFGSGRASPRFSNRMMQLRIVAQTVAVILLIALALVSQSGG